MGFHLVERVYSNVKGTSSTAQAVLAFLAHRADDAAVRKCFPSVEDIKAATHFGHTSISNALNDLREMNLLTWKSGGRHKGAGGRALANEYAFHLPSKPMPSSIRQTDNAVSAKRTEHTPPDGQSILREADTINPSQPTSQPSVIDALIAGADVLKRADYEKKADDWVAKNPEEAWEAKLRQLKENQAFREKMRHEVVQEAMNVCRVSDIENRKKFLSTVLRRDPDACLEVIFQFGSELDAGWHKNLRSLPRCLNSLLAKLPYIC